MAAQRADSLGQGVAAEAQALSIAADSQGQVYAVWIDDSSGDPDVTFSYHSASGVWEDPVRVNDDAGQATQADPVIAADPAGNATVVWTDDRNGSSDIYASFRPAGGTWDANVRVNDDAGTEGQGNPDLSVDGSGNAYAV